MKGKSLKDHYYYGQHTTDNLDDGYYGSGTILLNYYNKYGAIENVTYTKTIIDFYSNSTELNQAEYELIGDKYETDPMCLNLIAGGRMCGFSSETREKMSEARKNRWADENYKQQFKNNIKSNTNYGMKNKHQSEESKQKISAVTRGEKNGMYGKHHSDEAKSKMHNNKGVKHVNNGVEERMVKGEKLQQLLNEGYVYGRIKRNKNTK